jgi:hypothetical protein
VDLFWSIFSEEVSFCIFWSWEKCLSDQIIFSWVRTHNFRIETNSSQNLQHAITSYLQFLSSIRTPESQVATPSLLLPLHSRGYEPKASDARCSDSWLPFNSKVIHSDEVLKRLRRFVTYWQSSRDSAPTIAWVPWEATQGSIFDLLRGPPTFHWSDKALKRPRQFVTYRQLSRTRLLL